MRKLRRWYWRWWEDWNARHNPVEVRFWMPRIAEEMGLAFGPGFPGKEVLDVGGGQGRMKRDLLKIVRGRYRILERPGIDNGRDEYIYGSALDGGLIASGSIELMGCFEVLEHLPEPWVAVRNMGTWLKPGGHLLVSVPQYWHCHGWPEDYYRYTKAGLRVLMGEVGLIEVALWPMGGPCLLIWSAIELNFRFLRWPIICQLVGWPSIYLARMIDWLIFRHQGQWRYMDTRGWVGIWRKPIDCQR